mgnify:CR=1 FL=1
MADFSQLRKFAVDPGAVADFPLWMVVDADQPVPVLRLRSATLYNAPFYNESMRRAGMRMRVGGDLAKRDAALREEDRTLFAEFVLVGWDHVYDVHGAAVPFAASEALDYLRAMPDTLFDQVRYFARDESNFRPPSDPASAAGNSASASRGS